MKPRWRKQSLLSAILVGSYLCSPLGKAQSTLEPVAPQNLRLVFPTHGKTGEATRVRYTLTNDALIVNYEVTTRDIHPEKMGDTEIYNGNVVELFVCTTTKPARTPRPYYEFG